MLIGVLKRQVPWANTVRIVDGAGGVVDLWHQRDQRGHRTGRPEVGGHHSDLRPWCAIKLLAQFKHQPVHGHLRAGAPVREGASRDTYHTRTHHSNDLGRRCCWALLRIVIVPTCCCRALLRIVLAPVCCCCRTLLRIHFARWGGGAAWIWNDCDGKWRAMTGMSTTD